MVRQVFVLLSCLTIPFILHAQTSRWIISTKKPVEDQQFIRKSLKIQHSSKLEVWHFPSKITASEVRKILGPEIQFMEPDYAVAAFQTPNDPEFGRQWALKNIGQFGGIWGADIRAETAWATETGNDSVIVGVLDSGIDWTHPDLIDNIWQNLAEDADGDGSVLHWNGQQWIFDPGDVNQIDEDGNGYVDDFIGWDFVNNDNDPSDDHASGHGTHVSGIIGAQGNNGIGIAGVSWDVQLMGLKFLNQDGKGYTSDAIAALDYAINMGAQISNHSWGGSAYSQALEQIIDYAEEAEHVLVTAAGNNFGNDNDIAPLFPASYSNDNIISVGALTNLDNLAIFSNIGENSVDLFAPGKSILSTLPGGSYGYMSGSSMAAPMVTGAMVLLYSHLGFESAEEATEKIMENTLTLPSLYGKSITSGKLDLSQLFTDQQDTTNSSCEVVAEFSLPSPIVCYDELVIPTNLSSDASSYEWFFNGNLFSTSETPSYSVKRLFGTHEFMLVASNGSCVDSFSQTVKVKWLYLPHKLDTVHCGPSLTMPALLQAPGYTYEWTKKGDVIGTGKKMTFTESGKYYFTVFNNCGHQKSTRIDVSLQPDCVWPGDADANGVVNLKDYLTIGLIHGSSGPTRTNASTTFSAQNTNSWNQAFPSSHSIAADVDYCHVDADGNGQIDAEQDGNVVRQNFQGSFSGANSANSLIHLGMEFDQSSMSVGDTAFFDIRLESVDSSLLQDVYGVALTLSYDMPLSQPIHILPQSSFLDDGTGIDTLVINDFANRKLHFGITRLNQSGTNGNGILAIGGITVMIDNIGIDSTIKQLASFSIKISQALLIRSDGSTISLNNLSTQSLQTIEIRPQTPQETQLLKEEWRIGPIPAKDKITLYAPPQASLESSPMSVQIVNLTGQRLWESPLSTSHERTVHLNLPRLAQGVYWLKLIGNGFPQTFPLIIRE